MSNSVRDKFRAVMDLSDWLENVAVHAPGMWENDLGPAGWYAVAVYDDDGIVAYFRDELDACRFRLDYINRKMNP